MTLLGNILFWGGLLLMGLAFPFLFLVYIAFFGYLLLQTN